MKTIEEILYVEFRPDSHLVADCCPSQTEHTWGWNELLVREGITRDGKVTFICPACNSTYNILERHLKEAQTRIPSTYATGKD